MNHLNNPYSNIKVLHYNFSVSEVQTLYDFIMKVGWINHDREELNQVINRICKIARTHELVTGDSKTT